MSHVVCKDCRGRDDLCQWCGGTGLHPEYNAAGIWDAADWYPNPWAEGVSVLCRTLDNYKAWYGRMEAAHGPSPRRPAILDVDPATLPKRP